MTAILQHDEKQLYGHEAVKQAIKALGGRATSKQIHDYLLVKYPGSSLSKTFTRALNILKKWEEIEKIQDKTLHDWVFVLKV